MKPFPCTKCGLCCHILPCFVLKLKETKVDAPEGVKKLIAEFPYGIREDGSCEKLNQDNTCAVYQDRPGLCNLQETAKASGNSYVKLYKAQAEFCNSLIDLRLPEEERAKYHVKI